MSAQRLLDLLWDRYAAQVPYAREFVRLAGGALRNDHVAFRSLRRPGSGIELFAPIFERLGWQRAGSYDFPDAKLSAIHLSHADGLPRVFLSELRQEELSYRARDVLSQLPPDPPPPRDLDALAAWFRAPEVHFSEQDVLDLEEESQYGAWLLLFGREVNHFTASVDDVEAWTVRLRDAGVPMKGEIEGAPGAGLRQTATRAAPRRVRLRRGEREWPYAYLELAERHGGFDGFVTGQARHSST
jgi:2-oxoadipate dioxygenase/decarboxylase-like protein